MDCLQEVGMVSILEFSGCKKKRKKGFKITCVALPIWWKGSMLYIVYLELVERHRRKLAAFLKNMILTLPLM